MATQHKKATETSSFNSILTWISYVSSIGCRRTTHNPMVPLDSPPRRIGTLWSASTECFYARINRAPKIVLHPVIVILVVIAIEGAGVVFPVPATKAMDAPMASTTSHHSSSIATDNLPGVVKEAYHVDDHSGTSIICCNMS